MIITSETTLYQQAKKQQNELSSSIVSTCIQIVCSVCHSSPADFTGHPAFHLDDIRGTGEAEASQHPLPALQLVHLQDGPSFLQLSLGRSNICCDLKHTRVLLYHAAFTKCKIGEAYYYKIHFDNCQQFFQLSACLSVLSDVHYPL